MKEENGKHNHRPTEKLKVLLFATLMLLPIFLLAAKSLVYVFNENQSTEEYQYIEKIYIKNTSTSQGYYELCKELEDQTQAHPQNYAIIQLETNFNINEYTQEEIQYLQQQSQTQNIRIETKYNFIREYEDFEEIIQYHMYIYQNTIMLTFRERNYYSDGNLELITANGLANITIYENNITENNLFEKCIEKMFKAYYYEETTINQTESTLQEIANSSIMTWTQQSILYNNLSGMMTGFGINNLFIIELLIYWLDLTAIYIVFDIIIELITYLTHLMTNGKRLDK